MAKNELQILKYIKKTPKKPAIHLADVMPRKQNRLVWKETPSRLRVWRKFAEQLLQFVSQEESYDSVIWDRSIQRLHDELSQSEPIKFISKRASFTNIIKDLLRERSDKKTTTMRWWQRESDVNT